MMPGKFLLLLIHATFVICGLEFLTYDHFEAGLGYKNQNTLGRDQNLQRRYVVRVTKRAATKSSTNCPNKNKALCPGQRQETIIPKAPPLPSRKQGTTTAPNAVKPQVASKVKSPAGINKAKKNDSVPQITVQSKGKGPKGTGANGLPNQKAIGLGMGRSNVSSGAGIAKPAKKQTSSTSKKTLPNAKKLCRRGNTSSCELPKKEVELPTVRPPPAPGPPRPPRRGGWMNEIYPSPFLKQDAASQQKIVNERPTLAGGHSLANVLANEKYPHSATHNVPKPQKKQEPAPVSDGAKEKKRWGRKTSKKSPDTGPQEGSKVPPGRLASIAEEKEKKSRWPLSLKKKTGDKTGSMSERKEKKPTEGLDGANAGAGKSRWWKKGKNTEKKPRERPEDKERKKSVFKSAAEVIGKNKIASTNIGIGTAGALTASSAGYTGCCCGGATGAAWACGLTAAGQCLFGCGLIGGGIALVHAHRKKRQAKAEHEQTMTKVDSYGDLASAAQGLGEEAIKVGKTADEKGNKALRAGEEANEKGNKALQTSEDAHKKVSNLESDKNKLQHQIDTMRTEAEIEKAKNKRRRQRMRDHIKQGKEAKPLLDSSDSE